MQIAETERLILREFHIQDAKAMYALNNDPEVIRYTGDDPFENVEAAKEFIKSYNHYSTYGFGRWSVISKESNEFIGWCGLKYTPEFDEYDIGFRIFKSQWNKGFATESAIKCIDLGFEKFNLDKIVGRAVKANQASIQVLNKIGLKHITDMDFHGMEGAKFEISKTNYP